MGLIRLVILLTVVSCSLAQAQTYNTRYDNVNIDQILNSKRLLDSYIQCLLDDSVKKCSPEGRDFKKYIPEAIRTNCAKCSDAQKTIVKKAAKHIINTRPQDWEKIRQKFDPQRQYQRSFNDFLNSP